MNDPEIYQEIARQLRKPEGDSGLQIAKQMNQGNRLMNLLAIGQVNPQAGDHILEIGMGNGFFVGEIVGKHPTVRYSGCDYSREMVDDASIRNQQYIGNGQVSFAQGTAEDLPFPDGTFNKVMTVNTIYFWEDLKKVLGEIYRVLKPAGRLSLAIRPKWIMKQYPFVKHEFRLFSKEDLLDHLRSNNFILSEIVEKEEPDQNLPMGKIKVGSLIVTATKSGYTKKIS